MTSSQDDKLYPEQAEQQRPYLAPETLGTWRQHPLSRIVLGYLRDKRVQMAEHVAEGVFNGQTVTPEYLHDVSVMCGVLKGIEELEAADVNEFYGTEPPKEEEKSDGK